jgi:hypothetical protein
MLPISQAPVKWEAGGVGREGPPRDADALHSATFLGQVLPSCGSAGKVFRREKFVEDRLRKIMVPPE